MDGDGNSFNTSQLTTQNHPQKRPGWADYLILPRYPGIGRQGKYPISCGLMSHASRQYWTLPT